MSGKAMEFLEGPFPGLGKVWKNSAIPLESGNGLEHLPKHEMLDVTNLYKTQQQQEEYSIDS